MKKIILKLSLSLATMAVGVNSYAQCPTMTCPSDITVSVDSGSCDAIVNYTLPTGVDSCNIVLTSQTFSYTGSQQMFVVPAGVTMLTVDAYGAQGGANWVSNINYGGYVQADIAVNPGDTLYVYVGEQPIGLTGGWNGGGNGETGGIGGGGASDVRLGDSTLNDRIVVAGAAGGAGYWNSTHVYGGLGGGLIGGAGYRGTIANMGGDPGTQTSSGNGTCSSFNNPICAGGFGYGGAPSGCGCEGYGGGSGWYGGGGSGNCRGGGGGSSYTIPAATNVTHTQGIRGGHGEITIAYNSLGPVTINQTAGLTNGAVFPVGITTNTFTGTDAFANTISCSFTVTVTNPIDTSTTLVGGTITSNETASGVTYQWLDCDNSFAVIVGETAVNSVVTANGNYAVEITNGACVDTSACINVSTVGVSDLVFKNLTLYPNPTSNIVTVDFGSAMTINYMLTSIEGRILKQAQNVVDNKIIFDLSKESKGIYLLKIENNSFSKVYKLIRE